MALGGATTRVCTTIPAREAKHLLVDEQALGGDGEGNAEPADGQNEEQDLPPLHVLEKDKNPWRRREGANTVCKYESHAASRLSRPK